MITQFEKINFIGGRSKKTFISHLVLDTEDIIGIEKHLAQPEQSLVMLKGGGPPVLLNHSQEELWFIKEYRTEVKGFCRDYIEKKVTKIIKKTKKNGKNITQQHRKRGKN